MAVGLGGYHSLHSFTWIPALTTDCKTTETRPNLRLVSVCLIVKRAGSFYKQTPEKVAAPFEVGIIPQDEHPTSVGNENGPWSNRPHHEFARQVSCLRPIPVFQETSKSVAASSYKCGMDSEWRNEHPKASLHASASAEVKPP